VGGHGARHLPPVVDHGHEGKAHLSHHLSPHVQGVAVSCQGATSSSGQASPPSAFTEAVPTGNGTGIPSSPAVAPRLWRLQGWAGSGGVRPRRPPARRPATVGSARPGSVPSSSSRSPEWSRCHASPCPHRRAYAREWGAQTDPFPGARATPGRRWGGLRNRLRNHGLGEGRPRSRNARTASRVPPGTAQMTPRPSAGPPSRPDGGRRP
jgi:hypothetical protein